MQSRGLSVSNKTNAIVLKDFLHEDEEDSSSEDDSVDWTNITTPPASPIGHQSARHLQFGEDEWPIEDVPTVFFDTDSETESEPYDSDMPLFDD